MAWLGTSYMVVRRLREGMAFAMEFAFAVAVAVDPTGAICRDACAAPRALGRGGSCLEAAFCSKFAELKSIRGLPEPSGHSAANPPVLEWLVVSPSMLSVFTFFPFLLLGLIDVSEDFA
jgi:hypothetical protein